MSGEGQEPVRVWIENGEGSISRGLVEVLSENGAVVRLVGAGSVASGDETTVRIALDRASPAMSGTARVRWVRPEGESSKCELEWTHSGPEREQLAWLILAHG